MMYFSIVGGNQPRILKINLDGSNLVVMVNSEISYPYGLEIDFVDTTLIWTDGKNETISSIKLDATGRKTLRCESRSA